MLAHRPPVAVAAAAAAMAALIVMIPTVPEESIQITPLALGATWMAAAKAGPVAVRNVQMEMKMRTLIPLDLEISSKGTALTHLPHNSSFPYPSFHN